MRRHIVLVTAITAMLLISWGCEQGSESITTPPPPAVTSQPQHVNAKQTVEPNEVPQPAKTEQAVKPEPNIPETPAAEPNVQLAQKVEPNKQQTKADQLCSICTDFLSKYVDQQGLVDYRALSRKKLELVTILDKFKTLKPDEYNVWSKDNKIAFWINAYNFEFIKIITDNYPIESTRALRLFWPPNSIRHIKGIWDQHKFIIMDEEFTLKELDGRFFQKEFDDPRIFFAIYYGSVSGLPLRNEAYCGNKLSNQLDEQVMRFITGTHGFKISRENQVVYLSPILQPAWYGQQFVAKYSTDRKFKQQEPATRAVLNFLTNYLQPQDISFLETGNYIVEYMRYDWTLNDRSSQ
jgi:hypothetical protein